MVTTPAERNERRVRRLSIVPRPCVQGFLVMDFKSKTAGEPTVGALAALGRDDAAAALYAGAAPESTQRHGGGSAAEDVEGASGALQRPK